MGPVLSYLLLMYYLSLVCTVVPSYASILWKWELLYKRGGHWLGIILIIFKRSVLKCSSYIKESGHIKGDHGAGLQSKMGLKCKL